MGTIQGTGGLVAMPSGFVAKWDNWSADLNVDTVDTTGFTDVGYKVTEPVLVNMTGSASGTGLTGSTNTPVSTTLLGSTAVVSAAQGAMTLTAGTGCTIGANVTVKKVGFRRPNAGKLDVSQDFESHGAITLTWA